ncbi:MAG: carbamoyltransferase HypF [Chloroflexi bacterium]|nr:carbamoyltransferase HypF [Chloroflexota bacterium]
MALVVASRFKITGVVQGVGFRPFVYGLAVSLGLSGWVINTSSGVVIEAEGSPEALEAFARDLVAKAPPVAHIESVQRVDIPPNGWERFEIRESKAEAGYVLISPDIATCPECLREIFDPDDRRYRYPFTNCTNCGPRFTIIADVPYDRPLTTMAAFQMCPDCQAEYDDPLNRRFHAQPNACPVCGPRVWLVPASADDADALTPPDDDPAGAPALAHAARLLQQGAILAIKGLGGFHLACDATNADAVRTLRDRKRRPAKPLAVMMASMEEVRRHCVVTPDEEALLTSRQCPIVLLEWRPDSSVAQEVAPNNRYLGVMLPYTPLHHILLHDAGRPLVMTSGNLSEEPIAQDNEEAWRRLRSLADWFLLHNRAIYARYDDSVWFVPRVPDGKGGVASAPQPLRRARGYAPYPVRLPFRARTVLATGTELKNTFCITRDEHAFISPHIGDMENLETLEHYETALALYERLFRLRPEAIACDLHPDYLATRYARQRAWRDDLPLVAVQHHHAHIAACMVDNARTEPVIGVALDGTGYGLDGRIWGGEWLVADLRGFWRAAWLEPLPLPGGDAGIRNPCRIAYAYLYALFGEVPALPFLAQMDEAEILTVRRQVERGLNTVMTTSCGRLFDAVAAMAGGRGRVTYEAQAAIEMEMASQLAQGDAYGYFFRRAEPLSWGDTASLPPLPCAYEVALKPLLAGVVRDVQEGRTLAQIGGRFHRTLAQMAAEVCCLISQATGFTTVALSGGCFQNRLLLAQTVEELRKRGLEPLLHRQVPANDGGLALGQAAIGHFALAAGDSAGTGAIG